MVINIVRFYALRCAYIFVVERNASSMIWTNLPKWIKTSRRYVLDIKRNGSERSGKCSENCEEKLEDVLPNAFLNLHNSNNNEKLEMTKSNNMMFVILHFSFLIKKMVTVTVVTVLFCHIYILSRILMSHPQDSDSVLNIRFSKKKLKEYWKTHQIFARLPIFYYFCIR